jgi:ribose 5-phosphate isomerase A
VIRTRNGETFVTDEGHHIIDVTVPSHRDIADLHDELKRHAGVVETGFFATEATSALIATASGVRVMKRD